MRSLQAVVVAISAVLISAASTAADQDRAVTLDCRFSDGAVLALNGTTRKPKDQSESYSFSMPARVTALGAVEGRPVLVGGTYFSASTKHSDKTLVVRMGAMLRILEDSSGDNGFMSVIWLDHFNADHSMQAILMGFGHRDLPDAYDLPEQRWGGCSVRE